MVGTRAGAIKAVKTIRLKYGDGFYRNIGRRGGQNGHTGGFAGNPALARLVGAKGGRKSKRGSTYVYTAVSAEGYVLSGSLSKLAEALGCSACTIYNACKNCTEYAGYTITRKSAKH